MNDHDDLDDLISAASAALDAHGPRAATVEVLLEHRHWWAGQQRRAGWMLKILLAGLAVYVSMFVVQIHDIQETELPQDIGIEVAFDLALSVCAPAILILTAAGLARRPSFVAQIVARSLLWVMTLAVGTLQAFLLVSPGESGGLETAASNLILTLTSVGGLLALGEHGLRPPATGSFRPVAFRGLLSLSLVLGLGDVVILVLAGLLMLPTFTYAAPVLGLAAMLLAGAGGLLRLRTWGLLVTAMANIAELVVLGLGYLDTLGVIAFALVATALVQILLPIPVYLAMLRGRAQTEAHSRARHVPTAVLGLFVLFSIGQFTLSVLCLP